MATKNTKGKSSDNKRPRADHETRQRRWAQVAFGVFALIMVLTLVLSLVGTPTK